MKGTTSMKVRLLAFLAIAAMPLMGFDCINDPFYAAINVSPITASFPIDAVSITKTYGPIATKGFYNNGYTLQNISVYDLKISTSGAPSLGASSFTVKVRTIANGAWTPVATCTGNWSDFNTPQSIFNSTYFKTIDGVGLNTVITSAFAGNRLEVQITGTVANAPSPSVAYSVSASLYLQATGSLSSSN
jgi:hypothetical protein